MSVAASIMTLALLGGGSSEVFAKPAEIRWGATTAEVEASLRGLCAKGFRTRPIEPPFLPAVKSRQVQVDCDGYVFMGAPRWAEFVIGDDRLQMVWIMVDPGDQEPIVAAMTRAYGAPDRVNDKYIAFTSAKTAWRHKPAEVLFYAPELSAWAEPWFASKPR